MQNNLVTSIVVMLPTSLTLDGEGQLSITEMNSEGSVVGTRVFITNRHSDLEVLGRIVMRTVITDARRLIAGT